MPDRFIEVFLDAPSRSAASATPTACTSGPTAARSKQFPGVTAPYDRPVDPALHLHTDELSIEEWWTRSWRCSPNATSCAPRATAADAHGVTPDDVA